MADDTREIDDLELIYDWNLVDKPSTEGMHVEFDDETLRDGIQSPSVQTPGIEEKIEMLHMMVALGIEAVDIGLPGAGGRMRDDVVALATTIAKEKLPISPNCAARTVVADIEPIVDASQRAGIPIEASLFIGSSPVRQYVEKWTIDRMLKMADEAILFARKNDLPVMFVTEDTTRAHPDTIRRMYSHAIACGAKRVCAADTVGHATPHGVRMLIGLIRDIVAESGEDVQIDFHGHRDRGLGLENAIAAVEAGAHRVHGTGLGIGERCGNTPMELLLVNFRLMGLIDNDLTRLMEYCELVSRACGIPIPCNHPVVGNDAYRTSTGVHAAAVIKAKRTGLEWLADRVYSGVPAAWTGRTQSIEIGPMSGASNVIFWLQERGLEAEDSLVADIFAAAKETNHVLSEEEVWRLIRQHEALGT